MQSLNKLEFPGDRGHSDCDLNIGNDHDTLQCEYNLTSQHPQTELYECIIIWTPGALQ